MEYLISLPKLTTSSFLTFSLNKTKCGDPESTKMELEVLFPRLEKNGILIIDDYGFKYGARKAVDEYFKKKPFLIYVDHDCRLLIKN